MVLMIALYATIIVITTPNCYYHLLVIFKFALEILTLSCFIIFVEMYLQFFWLYYYMPDKKKTNIQVNV